MIRILKGICIVNNILTKYFSLIALSAFPIYGWSQDTTFYNNNTDKVSSLSEAKFYTVTFHGNPPSQGETVKTYFKSGQLKSIAHYPGSTQKVMVGKYVEYYENGKLHEEVNYNSKGHLEGKLQTYWPNGHIKRTDWFNDGKFNRGSCFNEAGKPVPHYNFQQKPEFPGGINRLIAFLKRKIKYPKRARKKNIQGEVIVSFIIDKNGKVTHARIVKGVSEALNQEALKVVNEIPDWEPGKEDGNPIKVVDTLPINFALQDTRR